MGVLIMRITVFFIYQLMFNGNEVFFYNILLDVDAFVETTGKRAV